MNRYLQFCRAIALFLFLFDYQNTFAGDANTAAENRLVSLGRSLFFDTNLSRESDVSCASCHKPNHAFSDDEPRSAGTGHQLGTRNTPSLMDLAPGPLFWDGRAVQLEQAVLQPITNPLEMGLADEAALIRRLRANASYAGTFASSFPAEGPTPEARQVALALAAFIRAQDRGSSPLDRYLESGDPGLLPAGARRGLQLFRGAANCITCHRLDGRRPAFTDGAFHSTAVNPRLAPEIPQRAVRFVAETWLDAQLGGLIASDPVVAEMGRYVVTRDPKDIGAFRTPSLRNVALTSPYMHDGSVKTLREAVDREIYYRSLQENRPNSLTESDRANLVEFLDSLSDRASGRPAN